MKSIRTYARYLDEGEIAQIDFFIESTYTDAQNRTYPNYLITKKGCDMIANKMTGKKGVLFTAAYVTAFEEMRQGLTEAEARLNSVIQNLTERAEARLNSVIQNLTERVEALEASGPAIHAIAAPSGQEDRPQAPGKAFRKRWMRTASEKLDLISNRLELSNKEILHQIYQILEKRLDIVLDEERIHVMEEYNLDDCSVLTAIFYVPLCREHFQRVVDHNLAPENRGW